MHFKLEHHSSISRRRWVSLAFTLLATGMAAPAAANPAVVTIHSGNNSPGNLDGNIFNYHGGSSNPSCGVPLSPNRQRAGVSLSAASDTGQVTTADHTGGGDLETAIQCASFEDEFFKKQRAICPIEPVILVKAYIQQHLVHARRIPRWP